MHGEHLDVRQEAQRERVVGREREAAAKEEGSARDDAERDGRALLVRVEVRRARRALDLRAAVDVVVLHDAQREVIEVGLRAVRAVPALELGCDGEIREEARRLRGAEAGDAARPVDDAVPEVLRDALRPRHARRGGLRRVEERRRRAARELDVDGRARKRRLERRKVIVLLGTRELVRAEAVKFNNIETHRSLVLRDAPLPRDGGGPSVRALGEGAPAAIARVDGRVARRLVRALDREVELDGDARNAAEVPRAHAEAERRELLRDGEEARAARGGGLEVVPRHRQTLPVHVDGRVRPLRPALVDDLDVLAVGEERLRHLFAAGEEVRLTRDAAKVHRVAIVRVCAAPRRAFRRVQEREAGKDEAAGPHSARKQRRVEEKAKRHFFKIFPKMKNKKNAPAPARILS
jgi:hypothetical protein